MLIEDLELAYGANFGMCEPLLDAAFHEEVLEVAWEDHDVVLHLYLLITETASGLTRALLIELV